MYHSCPLGITSLSIYGNNYNSCHRKANSEIDVPEKTQQMFECLLQSLKDAVIVTDDDAKVCFASNAALELFGHLTQTPL